MTHGETKARAAARSGASALGRAPDGEAPRPRQRFDSNRISLILPSPWRWPARIASLIFAGWLVLLFVGADSGFGIRGASLWATLLVVPLGLYATAYLHKDRRRRHGRLVADKHGLEFNARMLVPRQDIFAGHLIATRQVVVQILRYGHAAPLEIRVESEADGRTIIFALGLEISQGTAMYRLPAPETSRRVPYVIAATLVLAFGLALTWWFLPILLLTLAATVALMRARRRVTIGSDGVLIELLFWTRFVEYRDIVRAERFEHQSAGLATFAGVDLVLRSDELVRILTERDDMPTVAAADQAPAPLHRTIHARLVELMGRMGSSGETAHEAKLLRRAGRDPAAWFEDLAGLASGSTVDYRQAPVDPHKLWQLVEDPGAEHSVRVGAAAALASASAHRDPERLHATAATVVAPPLRKALTQIAKAKRDSKIVLALASVHDESNEP